MLKIFIWFLAALPSVDLFFLAFFEKLGANPQEALLRGLGTWAIVILLLTYSIPVLVKFGLNEVQKCRRMLGLWAFFYVAMHFSAFLIFENELKFLAFVQDVLQRPLIAFGFSSFILLIPLVITSNKFSMLFLGKYWKKIHKLIHLILLFSLVHYFLHRVGKSDFFEPIIALLIFLIIFFMKKITSRKNLR